ncbi:MAG TPA: hypothetical protein VHZ24_16350 [Pirellulales bacterium]|jgi:hypothetical protein|nr:hypothetical protein [Pirellulales bacterium]
MSIHSSSETAIFERIVLPPEPELNVQTARSLLALSFGSDDTTRMQWLADKAKHGSLTADEQEEIDSYERVGHYLAILQSKARLALRSNGGG